MKKYLYCFLLAMAVIPTYSHSAAYDLQQVMQDRYEKDCAIRDNYDLYEFPNIAKVLRPYVIKNKFVEEQAYVSNTFFLKNVEYKGIPVKSIEFSYGNMAKQTNQTLYFDLSTAKAQHNFAKIKFNFKQPKQSAGLDIEKKGKFATVQCYWSDVNFTNQ
ncbi:hypothetical protein [Acinetobacter ihumii]|uniref:hypothetical protein n=1 Tax=Acinetobacter ihumii TaxID=2483802 RepID=UPI00103073A4|nr:hypothetical protein [Acinetobacter ihumii]